MFKLDKQAKHTAHKIAYLAALYPDRVMSKLAESFEMSPIDFNVGAWLAQDMGLIEIPNGEPVKFLKKPLRWNFGPEVRHLEKLIPYVFNKLAENESDMEENYFSNWALTYKGHDILVVLQRLMAKRVMTTYTLTNTSKDEKGKKIVDTYMFYTLWENVGKEWGRKQFKNPKRVK